MQKPSRMIYLVTCTQEDNYELPLFATYSPEAAKREMEIWKENQLGNSYWLLDTLLWTAIELLGTEL